METIMDSSKERLDRIAMQRSGDTGMLILPWTKQILTVLWQHLRLLVHVIYYSFMAVFQMFRLEVHFRITDETGHHVQHMSTSTNPAESFILSSLFDGGNGVIAAGANKLAKCGVESYAGSSHTGALLSGLRAEELCCSLVDDFVMRATECFSDSDNELCLGHHPRWNSNDSGNWDIYVAEHSNDKPVMPRGCTTSVDVHEPVAKCETTTDLEESSWDEDDDDDDELSNSKENQAVWDSFTKSSDPYNPFSFSACISSSSKESASKLGKRYNNCDFDSCSTYREESPQNRPSQKRCVDAGRACSDSESDWDSSGDSGAEEHEENEKLWELFSQPADPYNPLHFAACTNSCGPSRAGREPEVPTGQDDERGSFAFEEPAGASGSEEAHCSEEDEIWNSFSQSDDPYHPLHFRACLRSSPVPRDVASPSVQLPGRAAEGWGVQQARRSKPRLPKRHFKHYCPLSSCDRMKVTPWMKRKPGRGHCLDLQKEDKPAVKKVRFSPVVKVHVMRAWSFALQASRRGPWEEMARDRDRFHRRIVEAEQAIGYCLRPSHREKILARLQHT